MTSDLPSRHVQPPAAPRDVPRRTVLQGALVAAFAVVASPLLPTAASASVRARLAGQGVRKGTARVHGHDGTATDMPTVLGAALDVGAVLAAGTVLTLAYDSRLYRLRPDLLLTRAGAGSAGLRHQQRSVQQAGAVASVEVVVHEPLSPGRYELLAGVLDSRRYPKDLIMDPIPLRLRARSSTGELLADEMLSRPLARDEVPWGAALGAAWVDEAAGHSGSVCWPALVTLLSVGPAAVPAGTQVRVLLDSQAFASVDVAGAGLSDGTSFPGTARSDVIGGVRQDDLDLRSGPSCRRSRHAGGLGRSAPVGAAAGLRPAAAGRVRAGSCRQPGTALHGGGDTHPVRTALADARSRTLPIGPGSQWRAGEAAVHGDGGLEITGVHASGTSGGRSSLVRDAQVR